MSVYVNQVALGGRIVREPSQRSDAGPVEFRIAVNRRAPDKETGEWKDVEKGYYTIVCWGSHREQALALANLQDVVVSGRLVFDEWEKDGVKRESVKVVASTITVPPGASDTSDPEW